MSKQDQPLRALYGSSSGGMPEEVNYIKHLTAAFEKMVEDTRLNPTHVSLYVSLFQFWNLNWFRNPFSIARNEVMKVCKIASNKTYLKCLKDLDTFGYIQYLPSKNPFKGSEVEMCTFYTSPTQALHQHNSKNDTSDTQALPPSINYVNLLNNNKHSVYKPPPLSNSIKVTDIILNPDEKEEVEKKEKFGSPPRPRGRDSGQKERKEFQPPAEQEVIAFFQSRRFPTLEAQKFFNYYQSTGWKVGKNKPMQDWQAAARNWILNAKKFAHEADQRNHTSNTTAKRNGHLHINPDKDYGELL